MIVCFVKDSLNGCILNVLQYHLKSLQKCAKMIYPFFCETCEQKMSVCFKCKLSCSNLNNSLICFLCLHKCHVECASENKFKQDNLHLKHTDIFFSQVSQKKGKSFLHIFANSLIDTVEHSRCIHLKQGSANCGPRATFKILCQLI